MFIYCYVRSLEIFTRHYLSKKSFLLRNASIYTNSICERNEKYLAIRISLDPDEVMSANVEFYQMQKQNKSPQKHVYGAK